MRVSSLTAAAAAAATHSVTVTGIRFRSVKARGNKFNLKGEITKADGRTDVCLCEGKGGRGRVTTTVLEICNTHAHTHTRPYWRDHDDPPSWDHTSYDANHDDDDDDGDDDFLTKDGLPGGRGQSLPFYSEKHVLTHSCRVMMPAAVACTCVCMSVCVCACHVSFVCWWCLLQHHQHHHGPHGASTLIPEKRNFDLRHYLTFFLLVLAYSIRIVITYSLGESNRVRDDDDDYNGDNDDEKKWQAQTDSTPVRPLRIGAISPKIPGFGEAML